MNVDVDRMWNPLEALLGGLPRLLWDNVQASPPINQHLRAAPLALPSGVKLESSPTSTSGEYDGIHTNNQKQAYEPWTHQQPPEQQEQQPPVAVYAPLQQVQQPPVSLLQHHQQHPFAPQVQSMHPPPNPMVSQYPQQYPDDPRMQESSFFPRGKQELLAEPMTHHARSEQLLPKRRSPDPSPNHGMERSRSDPQESGENTPERQVGSKDKSKNGSYSDSDDSPMRKSSRKLSANKGRPKTYKSQMPSVHCHVCTRLKAFMLPVVACSNLKKNGSCRKIVCARCFAEFGWDWNEATKPGSDWTCVHCRGICPPRAQCHIYEKANEKRKFKNESSGR
eukprot:CAMPEP_0184708140 /NCGR_PEP_ID=MMETSP0313-20130426/37622_1 /TAXON_ID=2792 /ORGANISM="Porphyridium aerugineum, Strain SAG 1380-2" /LENGTH=335 /DNA_ID=CAMNT_0027169723 /DNA_START=2084 /DNA_END=3091 /DNA_ORIENTATION=+